MIRKLTGVYGDGAKISVGQSKLDWNRPHLVTGIQQGGEKIKDFLSLYNHCSFLSWYRSYLWYLPRVYNIFLRFCSRESGKILPFGFYLMSPALWTVRTLYKAGSCSAASSKRQFVLNFSGCEGRDQLSPQRNPLWPGRQTWQHS